MSVAPKVLDVAGVSKSFGAVEVLSDVSFQVDKGETVCVLGPSGSGKSTLLRCINWLERPDAGRVYLNGKQIGVTPNGMVMTDRDLSRRPYAYRDGVPAFRAVAASHRAAEHHRGADPGAEAAARRGHDEAMALLEKVGLTEKRDAFPARLSGGQKQRVGIARALAIRPDLLLFDEPTSALDPELVGEVLVVMRDLAREGMTMVVVTHEMGFARDAATRVMFLDRGRAVETASPERFFSNPETERARQFIQRYSGGVAKTTNGKG